LSVIRRHPRIVLACMLLLIVVALAAAAEIVLRLIVPYQIDYYAGISASNTVLKYPYGDIYVNSHGYPDREWNLADPRPRIGVFGDSVTFGVGAGAGYRFGDLLAVRFSDRVFMNFGLVGGNGITGRELIENLVALAKRYGVKKMVYGMNLNDILPASESGELREDPLIHKLDYVAHYLDALRTRS